MISLWHRNPNGEIIRTAEGITRANTVMCKQKRDERIPIVACKKDRGTLINPLARRSHMPYSHDPIAFTHLQMSISLRRQELLRTQKVHSVSYMSSKNI
jgi:hypothetical protein